MDAGTEESMDKASKVQLKKCQEQIRSYQETNHYKLMSTYDEEHPTVEAMLQGLEEIGCAGIMHMREFFEEIMSRRRPDISGKQPGKVLAPIPAATLCTMNERAECEDRGLGAGIAMPWVFIMKALFNDDPEQIKHLLPIFARLRIEANHCSSVEHTRYRRVRKEHKADFLKDLGEKGRMGVISRSFVFCEDPREVEVKEGDVMIKVNVPKQCPWYIGKVNRGEGILIPYTMVRVTAKYDAGAYGEIRGNISGARVDMEVDLIPSEELEEDAVKEMTVPSAQEEDMHREEKKVSAA